MVRAVMTALSPAVVRGHSSGVPCRHPSGALARCGCTSFDLPDQLTVTIADFDYYNDCWPFGGPPGEDQEYRRQELPASIAGSYTVNYESGDGTTVCNFVGSTSSIDWRLHIADGGCDPTDDRYQVLTADETKLFLSITASANFVRMILLMNGVSPIAGVLPGTTGRWEKSIPLSQANGYVPSVAEGHWPPFAAQGLPQRIFTADVSGDGYFSVSWAT